ncbi:hypothetical protein Ae168Ps1_1446c [Pseudonocardia sp. Ae168_Ps1]|jgi:hypothetical protein|nr:hypothetical protein Ae150APs1_1443c [Pseudonocardia sp. Ae150A_Ps1]OLL79040.1 hypothetical protein Ae168Ps1_1446c [Pseudonocardia sp. Ae168_Ps1]OLL86822.1 hypothetical protein Ae263Ps1_3877 [Pseudonocardia sp. Ae263_Ps1]OLL93134.1 hypothetical protein Ae356Ps1_3031c [Pseudonocardia sp. Ae356_Ps1]
MTGARPRLLTSRRHIDLCLINGGTCPGLLPS